MRIRIMDTTLRDGMHSVSHQMTVEEMIRIADGLEGAGVDTLEVSHGEGLAGHSIQYGFAAAPDKEYLKAVSSVLHRTKLAVLLLPGVGTKEELDMAASYGAKVARIATHVTEADISQQHMQLAKEIGMEVIGFLMMAHMVPPEIIAHQARLMESYGADIVYVVDSAGALVPNTTKERVQALKKSLKVQVGFHGHNNLSMAVANTLMAVENGATAVDGTLKGLGAGSGNAATEVLVAVLHKLGYETEIDLYKIMDAAEKLVKPIMRRPQEIDTAALTLGYAGVYSSFLLHAYRASERFGIDARDILIELGRRKVVGGQEDLIIDVAYELAKRKGKI